MLRITQVIVATLALTIGPGAVSAQSDSIHSPTLRVLHQRLGSGDVSALGDFWRGLSSTGTPLVEPIAGDARFMQVTFLYRGDSGTRSVAVIALENHQLANDRYFALARMRQLGTSDVWFRTYRLRADARFTYRLSVNDERLFSSLTPAEWMERRSHLIVDSLNPRRVTTRDGVTSLVELPNAPIQTLTLVNPKTPAGTVTATTVGSVERHTSRVVQVYTPHGYSRSSPAVNLVVVLDGEEVPLSMPVPTILDNLIATRAIAPTIAVMVSNRPELRVTDLDYSVEFAAYLRDELMPWIAGHYAVPSDPRHIVIAGRSVGGSAAAFVALSMPAIFGNVMSQSGGFASREVPRPAAVRHEESLTEDDFPQGEWLTREIATTPRKRVRFYVEVGNLEDVAWELRLPQYATPTVLVANRHLRDVLQAKGYSVTYHEYNGPHDPISWRGTFGDGLVALIGRVTVPMKRASSLRRQRVGLPEPAQ